MILELQEINLSGTGAHTTIKKLQQPKSQRPQIYSIPPTKKTGLSPFFHFLGNFYVLRAGAFAMSCVCVKALLLAGYRRRLLLCIHFVFLNMQR